MNEPKPVSPPSPWLLENLDLIRAASALGPVVDLACGRGRHALHLAKHNITAIGLDRNREHLDVLTAEAERADLRVSGIRFDLEAEHETPLKACSCGALLVFRFLYRPLARAITEALRPGGILVYETFAEAHRATGRGPKRAEFYLAPGELPRLFPNLEVISFEEGPNGGEQPEITARLVARKA